MHKNFSFKKFLTATMLASAVVTGHPAFADYTVNPMTSSVPSAPAINWTGVYLGAHAGGIFVNYSGASDLTGTTDSYMGGGQIGYNFQIAQFVLGVEGDVSATNVDAKQFNVDYREDWMSTLRGRVGYAFGRVMPYLTAGLGMTNSEIKIPGVGSDNKLHEGFAGGLGLDGQLTDHWIAGVEYLYVNVPTDSVNVGGTTVRSGSDNNIVRAALSYRF